MLKLLLRGEGNLVFSSLTFLYLFLPINLILYFSSRNQKYRNWILIIFSLFFYAYGEPVWITLLVFSATVDFFHGQAIEKYRGKWQSKAALISSIVINLSLLGFFKYWGFFIDNINFIFQQNLPYREFMLPIGISFYTFQTLSYSIDVYLGEVKAQKEYHKFLLFVSLFHQLVAGPIVRYKDIASEIEHRTITLDKFSYGVNRFAQGLAKKVLIANTAGSVATKFLDNGFDGLTVTGAWFGIAMFAFQIYFDFSGYSDMAIGLGRMFGFTYKENFNYPYISRSATEFWRRWHMSLGSFFRDYIYIPLGGNRRLQVRNLFVVWALTGLWHGASWNFVVWGMFYGVLIFIEKVILIKVFDKTPKWISHTYLLVVMLVGWVFFYFTDLSQGVEFIKIMFGLGNAEMINSEFMIHFMNNIVFFIIAAIASTPALKWLYGRVKSSVSDNRLLQHRLIGTIDAAIVAVVIWISTAFLVGESYNPFLYFRF